jgi:rubredoxin
MTGPDQHSAYARSGGVASESGLSREVPVVRLACTACQLVYEPDLTSFSTGNTGCPRCGGWTWIAQLDTTPPDFGGVR